MAPRFSVIIPTYNRSQRLLRAVRSVLEQTHGDLELLVMDDGSTDDTPEVMAALEDPRLVYDWQPNSGGPATPRNRGLERAQGDWVCLLDADDYWYPGKLAAVAEAIARGPKREAYCHHQLLKNLETGQERPLRHGPDAPNLYRTMLIEGNRLAPSAITLDRAFLNEHALRFNTSPGYVIVEDFDMWLRVALAGGRFEFLDQTLGVYTVEGDNISLDAGRYWPNLERMLHDHVYGLQRFEPDRDALWRRIKARLLVSEAKLHGQRGRLHRALSAMARAFVQSPGDAAGQIVARLRAQGRTR